MEIQNGEGHIFEFFGAKDAWCKCSPLCLIFSTSSITKEAVNNVCNVRGYEIIFPYEKGVNEIKKKFSNSPSIMNSELNKFKVVFEKDFYGISLYKEAGCSNARLTEYLQCLVSTDGKDCKIYYSQMRIVD